MIRVSLTLEQETRLMEDKLLALRYQMEEERKKRAERKRFSISLLITSYVNHIFFFNYFSYNHIREGGGYWSSAQKGPLTRELFRPGSKGSTNRSGGTPARASSAGPRSSGVGTTSTTSRPLSGQRESSSTSSSTSATSGTDAEPPTGEEKVLYSRPRSDMWISPFASLHLYLLSLIYWALSLS